MFEIRYLKITLIDGTRFILRVTGESPAVIRGYEVNADGDEVVPAGYERRLRFVDRGLIKKAVELRMSRKYATLAPRGEDHARVRKSPAQIDAEITEEITEALRVHARRRLIPGAVKAAIEAHAAEFIAGSYRRHETIGGKEPCVSVGLVTDYLRQAYMPEDFRYATKDQQRTWTRSVLESMRRRGQIGSSFGATSRCYEPKR